ncbi:basic proline-rich protein-like [Poecile atricapillus]|uniref:basic proline-rich protein-like n=1 Tax=Poecile atricapillus TaxID=48891 RepID=UPI0027395F64|nr:basic proline-rich protein-like [Poecile atricapillus]
MLAGRGSGLGGGRSFVLAGGTRRACRGGGRRRQCRSGRAAVTWPRGPSPPPSGKVPGARGGGRADKGEPRAATAARPAPPPPTPPVPHRHRPDRTATAAATARPAPPPPGPHRHRRCHRPARTATARPAPPPPLPGPLRTEAAAPPRRTPPPSPPSPPPHPDSGEQTDATPMGDCHIGCRTLPPRGCPSLCLRPSSPPATPRVPAFSMEKRKSAAGLRRAAVALRVCHLFGMRRRRVPTRVSAEPGRLLATSRGAAAGQRREGRAALHPKSRPVPPGGPVEKKNHVKKSEVSKGKKISRLCRSGVAPGLTAPSGRRRSSGRNVGASPQGARRPPAAAPPPRPARLTPCRRPGGGWGARGASPTEGWEPVTGARGSGARPLAHEPSSFPVFTLGPWFTRWSQDAAVLERRFYRPSVPSAASLQHPVAPVATGLPRICLPLSTPPPRFWRWGLPVAGCVAWDEVPPTHSSSLRSLAIFNTCGSARASLDPEGSRQTPRTFPSRSEPERQTPLSDVIHDKPPVGKGGGKQNILLPFPQVTTPDLESFAAWPSVEVGGRTLLSAAAPHTPGARHSSEGSLMRVAGTRLSCCLHRDRGLQSRLPSSCPRGSSHSHASLVLPASRVEDALPPSRLTPPPPPCYRLGSLLLQHRGAMEGARGGSLAAVPGQRQQPGHESSSQRRGTPNP